MLELDTRRSFKENVDVYGTDGQVLGCFDATFVVVPHDVATAEENKDKRMVDLCVESVDESQLKLKGPDGELKGADLLSAAKSDPAIGSALLRVYNETTAKKNLQPT